MSVDAAVRVEEQEGVGERRARELRVGGYLALERGWAMVALGVCEGCATLARVMRFVESEAVIKQLRRPKLPQE